MTTLLAGRSVYLDSNIFIFFAEGFAEHEHALKSLFASAASGETRAITSELTLAEVLVKPIRDGMTELQEAYRTLLSSAVGMIVLPITRSILLSAARMRAERAIQLPDALHAATASAAGCDFFLTEDQLLRSRVGMPALALSDLGATGSMP